MIKWDKLPTLADDPEYQDRMKEHAEIRNAALEEAAQAMEARTYENRNDAAERIRSLKTKETM